MAAFVVNTIMWFGLVVYLGGPAEALRVALGAEPTIRPAAEGTAAVECAGGVIGCDAARVVIPLSWPANSGGAPLPPPEVLPPKPVSTVSARLDCNRFTISAGTLGYQARKALSPEVCAEMAGETAELGLTFRGPTE